MSLRRFASPKTEGVAVTVPEELDREQTGQIAASAVGAGRLACANAADCRIAVLICGNEAKPSCSGQLVGSMIQEQQVVGSCETAVHEARNSLVEAVRAYTQTD